MSITRIEQLVLFLETEQEQLLFEPNEEGLGLQDEYLRSDGTGRAFLRSYRGREDHLMRLLQKKPMEKERAICIKQEGKNRF